MITQQDYIRRIMEREGVKHDDEKLKWSLLPFEQVQEVVEVLQFGAAKYDKDNWKYVKNAEERYFDAAMRHIIDHKLTGETDVETGRTHLAHAICCLLFWMWHDKKRLDTEE